MTEGELYLEKRKFKRAYIQYSVKYKLMPKETAMSQIKNDGKGRDLSIGGVRIEGEISGEPGDVIKLEFKVEQKEELITAFAEIKWIKDIDKQKQFGLEFLALKEEDRDLIEKITQQ
jgi:c-di-GMP-binding flagellar brake protein YcgR